MCADRPVLGREAGPDRAPHLARDLAVQLADAVDVLRGAQRERGHVEERTAAVVVVAEREEGIAVGAERSPRAGEMLLDEVERERVVSRGNRRVRREDRRLAHVVERRLERFAPLDQIADPLEDDECRVPLVEVPRRRVRAHRFQRTYAADAEDDLLLDARFAVAAVEPRRQLAIPRRVLFEIGVEQIQLHAPEPYPPHRDEHSAVAERHGDDARVAVGRGRALDRRIRPVEALVDFLLPPFRRHGLVEVSLRIHESHADERNPEIARFLAVIAGKHPQAARVDRQRLMERELGGEVGDRPRRVGEVTQPPGFAGAPRRVECRDRVVVPARGTSGRRQPFPGDPARRA